MKFEFPFVQLDFSNSFSLSLLVYCYTFLQEWIVKKLPAEKSILFILPKKKFNETEFLVTKRILERHGFKIFIASDAASLCVGRNGLKIKPDVVFFNMNENNFRGIVFIGGNGVKEYWENRVLHNVAQKFLKQKKLVTAICSAPVILANAGILKKIDATCYPADKQELLKEGGCYLDAPVVVRKYIITARDSESSEEFAETIVAKLNES